jgi:hypothetical protein
MARVRSTARVTREGEEAKATETAPISEVMRQLGLVVAEEVIDEGALLPKLNKLTSKKKMLMKKRKIITL